MLYAIIRTPIFEPNSFLVPLFTGNRKLISLDQTNLTQALKKYENIYLTDSLEKAEEIANGLYHHDGFPKVSGSMGLVLQLTLNSSDLPEQISFDPCEFRNEWVKQQLANYQQQHSEERMTGYKITPKQVAKVEAVIVPALVSARYPAHQSQEFSAEKKAKCSIM